MSERVIDGTSTQNQQLIPEVVSANLDTILTYVTYMVLEHNLRYPHRPAMVTVQSGRYSRFVPMPETPLNQSVLFHPNTLIPELEFEVDSLPSPILGEELIPEIGFLLAVYNQWYPSTPASVSFRENGVNHVLIPTPDSLSHPILFVPELVRVPWMEEKVSEFYPSDRDRLLATVNGVSGGELQGRLNRWVETTSIPTLLRLPQGNRLIQRVISRLVTAPAKVHGIHLVYLKVDGSGPVVEFEPTPNPIWIIPIVFDYAPRLLVPLGITLESAHRPTGIFRRCDWLKQCDPITVCEMMHNRKDMIYFQILSPADGIELVIYPLIRPIF